MAKYIKAGQSLAKILPGSAMALAAISCTSEQATVTKPNIVIIVADDLGWGDLGYHGSVIPTPNIDNFISQGIELDRYYVAPVSSPTRCGLMTGRYPSRFGVRKTVIPPWRQYGLDETEETMADVLGQNGYEQRAIIGKWHLGHSRLAYYPLNRGFTHFYGHLNGALDYFDHTREGELDWHNDWESCYDEGYTTDLIAAEAARCISEYSKGDAPYFTYICFNAPHTPHEAPEEELALFISKEEFEALPSQKDKDGWTYRAMVSRLDKGVGKVLEAIENSGEKDNTLVLFMSDNGGMPGFAPYINNRPLRGHKGSEWDGGVRVCAAISWPNGFVEGRKIEQVTGMVDILPTLREIVGDTSAPKRPYDGISIYSVLNGSEENIERDFYLGRGAAISGRYKYMLPGQNNQVKIKEPFFNNIFDNPGEDLNYETERDEQKLSHLVKVVEEGDAIIPCQEELDFEYGHEGFVAPHEWKITNP